MLENQGEKRNGAVISRIFSGFLLFAALFYVYATVLALLYGPSAVSLSLGCRWDCGWYASIVRNGYVSAIPPTVQDLDRSNVAFFPLFPLLGRAFAGALGLANEVALPLVSIVFALGIALLLPSLATRRRLLLLAAYPATFYFFVGYSESVYCFFLFAGLVLLLRKRVALLPVIFAVGVGLGLTRLTGFVIPGGVFGLLAVGALSRRVTVDRRVLALAGAWTVGALVGAGAFFYYTHLRFGAWNLYFQTLDLGWHKEFSVSGFFRQWPRAFFRNLLPPVYALDPARMSGIINADLVLAFGAILIFEGRRIAAQVADRSRSLAQASIAKVEAGVFLRFALLAAAFAHFLITTLGDSGAEHRWGNGMRYSMPAFYFLVFFWDEAWMPRFLEIRPVWRRNLYFAILAFWIPYQLYYVYLFTRTIWVS